MKIEKLKLKNFRGFHDEVVVKFGNLTAFVGKNDIGKTTILEALDIFFNDSNAANKLAPADLNVDARDYDEKDHEIIISVCFSGLPETIAIGTTNAVVGTKYLLNAEGELEIVKRYVINYSKTYSIKTFIRTHHPVITNFVFFDLNNSKLKEIARLQNMFYMVNIFCNKNTSTKHSMLFNKVIDHYNSILQLTVQYRLPYILKYALQLFVNKLTGKSTNEIEVTLITPVWEKLHTLLPLYSLFQADRKNTDGDREIQDPLKEAVKEILTDNTLQQKLNEVATTVEAKLKDVANRTLAKLREMDPAIAKTLQPVIPPVNSLNWQDIFKNVSIVSDENIPINKRGSGVKRLVLLNFFRAEVERRQNETNLPNVIYAIEEPEISQHSENQKKLIEALTQLAETNGVQVIITTHSPIVVKALNFDNIRIVSKDNKGSRKVINTPPQVLPYRSLNEVNYIAFSEISEGYHDELYGHMIERGWLGLYKQHKKLIPYIEAKFDKKGNDITNPNKPDYLTKTEIIRNQIHHPENKYNPHHFTEDELRTSIEEMRKFIQAQNSQTDQQE